VEQHRSFRRRRRHRRLRRHHRVLQPMTPEERIARLEERDKV
jgi:hypothetical protein